MMSAKFHHSSPMSTPASPTPARPSLDELFETCAANLKLDDVTRAPFTPVHITPVVPVDGARDDGTRAQFNQFIANAPAHFVGVTV